MSEGTDADVRLPPVLEPVTPEERSALLTERERTGATLNLVTKDGQWYLALRGDGAAEWALTALRLRRVGGVPGTTHPPIDPNYAGKVLRDVVAKLNRDTSARPWVELTALERVEWQIIAHRVWDAYEFGHGPDHEVPPRRGRRVTSTVPDYPASGAEVEHLARIYQIHPAQLEKLLADLRALDSSAQAQHAPVLHWAELHSGVLGAVTRHHGPVVGTRGVYCQGCWDTESEPAPDWPCSTWQLIAEALA